MQHNRAGRKLGRTTAHRKALFRNQLSSLITHERIQTTLPKAKDLRPLIEKMITLGKRGGLHARRLALKTIPEATTVKKLFEEIAPRFKERADKGQLGDTAIYAVTPIQAKVLDFSKGLGPAALTVFEEAPRTSTSAA